MCYAPTAWFAQHISTNDMLNFGSFLHEVNIPAVLIVNPDGKLAGQILAAKKNHEKQKEIEPPVEKAA